MDREPGRDGEFAGRDHNDGSGEVAKCKPLFYCLFFHTDGVPRTLLPSPLGSLLDLQISEIWLHCDIIITVLRWKERSDKDLLLNIRDQYKGSLIQGEWNDGSHYQCDVVDEVEQFRPKASQVGWLRNPPQKQVNLIVSTVRVAIAYSML